MYRHKSTIKTKLHYIAVCHNHMLHRLHHHLPCFKWAPAVCKICTTHKYTQLTHKHTRAYTHTHTLAQTQSPIDIKYKNITFNKAPLFATENHFVCAEHTIHSYTQVFSYIYASRLCAAQQSTEKKTISPIRD